MAVHGPAPHVGGVVAGLAPDLVADGGRVDQEIGTLEGHGPGRLGEPLVPADTDTDAAVAGGPGPETGVAGAEVELLLVSRPVRDVRLPVDPQHHAVLDHRHRVEVHGRCRLEERDRDHGTGAGGHLPDRLDGRVVIGSGGPREVLLALVLREVPAFEQFGRHDEVGAGGDGVGHRGHGGVPVLVTVLTELPLDHCHHGCLGHRPSLFVWLHTGPKPFRSAFRVVRILAAHCPTRACGRVPCTATRLTSGSVTAAGPEGRPACPLAALDSTPRADGFHMPAEWEHHDRCYLVWPERTDNWRLRRTSRPRLPSWPWPRPWPGASRSRSWRPARQWEHARAACSAAITVVEITTDDAWVRDTGPTFVVNRSRRERRGVDWIFNAWGGLDGGLYFPWDNDDLVAAKVCEFEGAPRYRAPLVLEGGSIHVDGEGTCITTEECLLNPNRNPGLLPATRSRLNYVAYLGVEKVIWIPEGVYGDETDGHVDNLACFTRPGRVLLTWTEEPDDPAVRDLPRGPAGAGIGDRRPGPPARRRAAPVTRAPLHDRARRPRGSTQRSRPVDGRPGTGMAGSYVNFLIANSSVVHPLLGSRATTTRSPSSWPPSSPAAGSRACPAGRSFSAGATSTASPSRSRASDRWRRRLRRLGLGLCARLAGLVGSSGRRLVGSSADSFPMASFPMASSSDPTGPAPGAVGRCRSCPGGTAPSASCWNVPPDARSACGAVPRSRRSGSRTVGTRTSVRSSRGCDGRRAVLPHTMPRMHP